jgi:hypothetical protein
MNWTFNSPKGLPPERWIALCPRKMDVYMLSKNIYTHTQEYCNLIILQVNEYNYTTGLPCPFSPLELFVQSTSPEPLSSSFPFNSLTYSTMQ